MSYYKESKNSLEQKLSQNDLDPDILNLDDIAFTLYAKKDDSTVNLSNFTIIKVLGEGAFGKVYLVHLKKNKDQVFAMKAVRKDKLLNDEKIL